MNTDFDIVIKDGVIDTDLIKQMRYEIQIFQSSLVTDDNNLRM